MRSRFAPCLTNVHFLRPEMILFSPALRKLVNESNGVFLSVQKLRKDSAVEEIRPEMLKYSRRYRSILRACIEESQDLMEKSIQEKISVYRNFFTIFYCIECVLIY